jgi:hypothetical protein
LLSQNGVPSTKSVADLIIESNVSTTQTNTRQNFATCTLARSISVNMESTAASHTQSKIFKCVSFISFSQYVLQVGVVDFQKRTLTFTYTISKQSGVPSITNTTKHNVFTPTITRTFAEDLTCSYMKLSFVKIGKAEHL